MRIRIGSRGVPPCRLIWKALSSKGNCGLNHAASSRFTRAQHERTSDHSLFTYPNSSAQVAPRKVECCAASDSAWTELRAACDLHGADGSIRVGSCPDRKEMDLNEKDDGMGGYISASSVVNKRSAFVIQQMDLPGPLATIYRVCQHDISFDSV